MKKAEPSKERCRPNVLSRFGGPRFQHPRFDVCICWWGTRSTFWNNTLRALPFKHKKLTQRFFCIKSALSQHLLCVGWGSAQKHLMLWWHLSWDLFFVFAASFRYWMTGPGKRAMWRTRSWPVHSIDILVDVGMMLGRRLRRCDHYHKAPAQKSHMEDQELTGPHYWYLKLG